MGSPAFDSCSCARFRCSKPASAAPEHLRGKPSQGVSAQRRGAKLAGIFEASAFGTGSSVDRDAEVAYMLSTDDESMLDGEQRGAENALQRVESRPEPAGVLPQCGRGKHACFFSASYTLFSKQR